MQENSFISAFQQALLYHKLFPWTGNGLTSQVTQTTAVNRLIDEQRVKWSLNELSLAEISAMSLQGLEGSLITCAYGQRWHGATPETSLGEGSTDQITSINRSVPKKISLSLEIVFSSKFILIRKLTTPIRTDNSKCHFTWPLWQPNGKTIHNKIIV